jgi:catechol 2,3-dioxygenase-like lactoylglutathione lyase family enzyme
LFSHIVVGSDDVAASRKFYDATLNALGFAAGVTDELGRAIYASQTGLLVVGRPINGEAATAANGGTIAFVAQSPAAVDAWHAAGLANQGTECEEPPGIRRSSYGDLYVAYLRDPVGNKVCAVHRG